ncbi:MAG TPA: winged helix-turn-helix domain-containing protein [Candidatus Bilamarchaeaceae archaeon]|nr:winged helix-turn-helix domain-containing protein [Candidatus Bilamarchaeaceae archaeon]
MFGDSDTLFWYLFGATKGGPNRLRIVYTLLKRPANPHQLAKKLHLDYKTIQHHLEILVENDIVIVDREKKYGELYSPSPFTKSRKKILNEIWGKVKKADEAG